MDFFYHYSFPDTQICDHGAFSHYACGKLTPSPGTTLGTRVLPLTGRRNLSFKHWLDKKPSLLNLQILDNTSLKLSRREQFARSAASHTHRIEDIASCSEVIIDRSIKVTTWSIKAFDGSENETHWY